MIRLYINDQWLDISDLKSKPLVYSMARISFVTLINELDLLFSNNHVSVEEIESILKAYSSNRCDWVNYCVLDEQKYTRNLVHKGNGNYNLMILCWNKNQGSAIHDHSNSHCFIKVLDGQITEHVYNAPEFEQNSNALQIKSVNVYSVDEISYIHDKIGYHKVSNESLTNPAITLHLYCPPFDKCHAINEVTGEKTPCQVSYWSEMGTRSGVGQSVSK